MGRSRVSALKPSFWASGVPELSGMA
jgi:hypothetical protein